MNKYPEIGTFDVLGHGSDFGNLQTENGTLKNDKLILMIALGVEQSIFRVKTGK